MTTFTTPIPLTLYIHMPWCVRKCPYCDFNSHQVRDGIPEEIYINKLIEDLDQDLPKVWGRRLSAIFIGGGTPSLFTPESMNKLLTAINSRLPFASDLEITMEANPGTVEQKKFEGFKQAGINRLSIGIQSLNNRHLEKLGRIHETSEALIAIDNAKKAGFKNVNCDLMYGLPEQTLDEALYDLDTIIAKNPTHISWYQLTIEPNTLFHYKRPTLPEDDIIWDIQQHGEEILAKTGYQHYEVSAFAQNERQCQHNINYWEFGDYLGIGAGAHSKITDFSTNTVTRYWKTKHPTAYLDNETFISGEKTLTENDLVSEFMLNALRLKKPINTTLFFERTGLNIDVINKNLKSAKEKGLITFDKNVIEKTELGEKFLNDLIAQFFKA